jgi:hypothetical protein
MPAEFFILVAANPRLLQRKRLMQDRTHLILKQQNEKHHEA